VSWCQKKSSSGLYGAREISEADTPTIRLGATPSGLISDPPLPFPPSAYCEDAQEIKSNINLDINYIKT